jgi:hypothetical protein
MFCTNISPPSAGSKSKPTAAAGFLLGSPFDPEGRGNMFLRNIGLFKNFAQLQSEE